MYAWGYRLVVLTALLLAGPSNINAQTRTADIGATIFTDASPTALIRNRPLDALFAEGYTEEGILTQDVRIPHMLIFDPATKQERWVSKTSVGQPLILSAGTHVLFRKTGGNTDYSDFIVFSVPGSNAQLVPGCGNKCRGVSLRDRIEIPSTPAPVPTEPSTPLPPPNRPTLEPPRERTLQCENSIELRATPDRLTSIRKGLWKNLGNGLFAGSLSAASGGWQTGLIGLGLTVGGGAVADAWHPQHFRIRLGLDGQWQAFPAEPTVQPWNDLRIRLQVRATDLGGKVAEAIVEGHPECSAYLPLPNNRNYVYVFALRGKRNEPPHRNAAPPDQPPPAAPAQTQSQSAAAHPSAQSSATNNNQNNNANNVSVTINNIRPRRVKPEKTHTPPAQDASGHVGKPKSSHDHSWSDKHREDRKY